MPILLTNNFPPGYGGVQTMMYELAISMHHLGAEIIVVAPEEPGAQVFDQSCPFFIERYRGGQRLATGIRMMQALARARKRVKDRRILASGWLPAGLAAAAMPLWLRSPYMIITHGMELDAYRVGLKRPLLRYVYAKSCGALPNSNYTEMLMRKTGVRCISSIMPPGICPITITPRRASKPTILSVGRLVMRKGFDVTIAAVADLLPEFPQLHYEIIGHGPDKPRLQQMIVRLGLQEHVTFHGQASQEEKLQAYSRAWCFALPVRRLGGDVEGFGIVYLEAALAGLATIGGLDSGAGDAIADKLSGLVVDGCSVSEVRNALRTLLIDQDYARQLGSYGKTRALKDFAWENIAQRMLEVLALHMPYQHEKQP